MMTGRKSGRKGSKSKATIKVSIREKKMSGYWQCNISPCRMAILNWFVRS